MRKRGAKTQKKTKNERKRKNKIMRKWYREEEQKKLWEGVRNRKK
jgi:hypothetical protein